MSSAIMSTSWPVYSLSLSLSAGSLLSSEMLAVLMLYLWFGVGIACAAFCSHQLLLISRGPACHQSPGGEASPIRWADNLTSVFGKKWMLAVLVPHLKEK